MQEDVQARKGPVGLPGLSPFLDEEDLQFAFVGEGAANVVFELAPLVSPFFAGKLLRVPKTGNALPYTDLQAFWESEIKPSFGPDDLVEQHLVRLHSTTIITKLNHLLEEIDHDGSRRKDFIGDRVACVELGMLVDDMRLNPSGTSMTLQFKPKWLSQSPSAPSSAVRCRNCAREALRNVKKGNSKPIFCPLSLLPPPDAPLPPASLSPATLADLGLRPDSHTERLLSWLQTNSLLPRLRDAQAANDPIGPLEADPDDDRFPLAMTLRDCTVFMIVPAETDQPVVAKLGDLDRKNAAVKMEYWRSMERELVDGGFYEGKEEPRQVTDCVLAQGK